MTEIVVVPTLGLSEYLGDYPSRNYAHMIRKGLVNLFIQSFPGKKAWGGVIGPFKHINFLKVVTKSDARGEL